MARDFCPVGVPLIRLAGLEEGVALLNGCDYLDPDTVTRRWEHFRLRKGDVLLSTSASLGRVAVVDDFAVGAIPYTGIIGFRPRDDRVLRSFIPYALASPSFKRQIEAMGVGSVMRHFGPMHLRQMTLDLPPVSTQRAIAEVLGALADKIGANQRLVKVLSNLGAAVFASVDKRAASVTEVAQVLMGQSPPGSTYNEVSDGLPFYQGIRDFGTRYPSRRVWCSSPSRIAEAGDVLVSVRAPVGTLNVAVERCAIGRGVASLRSTSTPSVLYHAMAAASSGWAPFQAEGTVFGSIAGDQLRQFQIEWPVGKVLTRLEDTLAVLDRTLAASEHESQALVGVRDVLLPRLLSGGIGVSAGGADAEGSV